MSVTTNGAGLDDAGRVRRPTRRDAGGHAPAVEPRLLLSVEEAADLLHLGRTRCYELVMGGALRSVKVGRRRLVVRAGLEEFVERLETDQGALPAS